MLSMLLDPSCENLWVVDGRVCVNRLPSTHMVRLWKLVALVLHTQYNRK